MGQRGQVGAEGLGQRGRVREGFGAEGRSWGRGERLGKRGEVAAEGRGRGGVGAEGRNGTGGRNWGRREGLGQRKRVEKGKVVVGAEGGGRDEGKGEI